MKALRTFRVRPTLPAELEPLSELAMNLRWSWHTPAQELFRWADAACWEEVGGNPVLMLSRLSPARVDVLTRDATFLSQLRQVHAELERYLTQPRWAQSQEANPPRVAYFSPEFGLTHVMQTYSGGLGVLAGDHLKAASDLGLEMAGVGLLYRRGYFRQHLDAGGWQLEHYPDLNPHSLPLRRLERDGAPLTIEVDLGGRAVHCQVWRAQVGRVPLLLLDTDLTVNAPEDRSVTDKLYGGDIEHRLRQEIVLGIGGVRALELAIQEGEIAVQGGGAGSGGEPWRPEMFHSNEGHAGFLQMERIRRLVEQGLSFDEAIEASRAAVVFTTHTPVPAGIDVFGYDLMARYFGRFAEQCGVDLGRLLRVGQTDPPPADGHFNMALMGLRLSGAANGVSELHGRVARAMFNPLWPQIAEDEVPISSVTNGIHAPTWVGREMAAVYDRHLPPDWYHNPEAWARVSEIGDDVLWRARARARERMVQRVRALVREQAERRGENPAQLGWTEEVFDPDTLTIGFGRRFAEYKRGTLLLRQPERLRALVSSFQRPVQFVYAGKAHPRDELGKNLIRQFVRFTLDDPELRTRIVFVEDYDMDIARVLYQGADVWLNNPRRPYEACGTSGEKAVLNGALHCSTLDGWWDEMYDGENGFAIGTAAEHGDVDQQDAADAQSLFDLLERTMVPMFYDRVEGPLPRRWLARVRRSVETLGPRVLAERMVREYTQAFYTPLATRAARLAADDFKRARELAAWRNHVRDDWHDVTVRQVDGDHGVAEIGQRRDVEVLVHLGRLSPADVRVELLHGGVSADGVLDQPRSMTMELEGRTDDGDARYRGAFEVEDVGEYGLAVRVVPSHQDLATWADTGLVTWADPEHVGAGTETPA
ncbi:MAG: alpha-glucan family phosphorylase, partial [Nitriliruptorales bacterium]|nr:alpha-glucan family phosphorylase [Nitriliruptorales bacterium]